MLGLWSFTGAFSDVGPVLDRGMKMALDERGMKIQGKSIKYITRDDETKAGSATRRAEEAIDADGVKYIIGPWSSGVALAVVGGRQAKEGLPLLQRGTRTSRGRAATAIPSSGRRAPTRPPRRWWTPSWRPTPRPKRWHLLVADYAFGWSVEKYVKEVGKGHGIEFVGADRHPLGEREFSNYVTKAAANKPDVVP